MTAFIATLGIFLAVLAVLAAVADWWDGRETRDARRRNHARRVR